MLSMSDAWAREQLDGHRAQPSAAKKVKHLPNDLTNSCYRKWAGLWKENSRHRMACHRGGPVETPGDDGMPGEAKM